LEAGGSALDRHEAAVSSLEDDPVFDAGYGSHLNLDGRVECDAIVMDGSNTSRWGSRDSCNTCVPGALARNSSRELSPHMDARR